MDDLISRQAAIDALMLWVEEHKDNAFCGCLFHWTGFKALLENLPSAQPDVARDIATIIENEQDMRVMLAPMPSAQQERDIPKKPIATTDRAWGIPHRQAVCPKCDYYLGHVAFLGDYKGKRITYCETCGQAIDWEGWEFDE